MGIALTIALVAVIQFAVLLIVAGYAPVTPQQAVPEHPDRPWLRALSVLLLLVDVVLALLVENDDRRTSGELRGLGGLVFASGGVALMMAADACWLLSRRRPRTPQSMTWPVLLLGSAFAIGSCYGVLFVGSR